MDARAYPPATVDLSDPAPVESAAKLDLNAVFATLRRRIRLVVGVAAFVFLTVVLLTLQSTPKYTATASVILEPRKERVVDVQQVLSGLPADSAVVDSEVEILKSRALAEKVAAQLGLDRDPEFNEALRPKKEGSGLGSILSGLVGGGKSARDEARSPAEMAQRNHNKIIDAVMKGVKVGRAGLTYVIDISFVSKSPEKAAQIANGFASVYVNSQLDDKYSATRRASDWLSSKLTGLRQQAEASDAAVKQYEASNGLIGIRDEKGATLTQQEVSTLNSQVAAADVQVAEAQAKLNTARAQMQRGSNGDDVGEALSSQVVQDLRKRQAEVSGRLADLQGRYGPLHPEMLKAQRELADVDTAIKGEIQRLVSNLEAQAEVARQRAGSLRQSLARAHTALNATNQATVTLAQLQSRSDSDKAIYQSFLDRYKQTTAQQGLESADARVVSAAKIPTGPSFPNVPLNMALGVVLAAVAGLGAAILAEALENGVYTSADVERHFALPQLGSLPILKSVSDGTRTERKTVSPQDFLVRKPLSTFTEAFRQLRTSVLFARLGAPVQVVAITSALPAEGKSTASVCLARVAVMSGVKTVLVDCDLRRRTVNSMLKLSPQKGMLDVLSGAATLDEVLVKDSETDLDILPLTSSGFSAKDVFASSAMDRLLEDLRARYPFIVLDTAPVLPVADTRALAAKADTVLLCVRWRKTARQAVAQAIRQLTSVGAEIGGVALSRVDMREQARTGYNDAGYYYRSYRGYYSG